MSDLANRMTAFQMWKPQAFTTTVTTSTACDFGPGGGGQFGTTAILAVGAVSGTGGPSATFKIQECDTTNGTYTDITGAAFTAITTSALDAAAATLVSVFVRSKRYLQSVCTVAGTTSPSITASLVVMEPKRVIAPANAY